MFCSSKTFLQSLKYCFRKCSSDSEDDSSGAVADHWVSPTLVRYGWGHYTDHDPNHHIPETINTRVKTVIGSNQVHPLNMSDTDIDNSNTSNNNDKDDDERGAETVNVQIEAADPEQHPQPHKVSDDLSLMITLCESPHRLLATLDEDDMSLDLPSIPQYVEIILDLKFIFLLQR